MLEFDYYRGGDGVYPKHCLGGPKDAMAIPSKEITLTAQQLLSLGHSQEEIVYQLQEEFGRRISVRTLQRWLAEGHIKRPRPKVYNKYLRLEGNWAVGSDIHAPFTDMDLIDKLVLVGMRFNTKNLLICGDYLDQTAFSTFFVQHVADFNYELLVAQEVLEKLSAWYTNIQFTVGNHDLRIMRALEFKLSVKRLYKLIDKNINMSSYPYAKIHNKQTWHITHPDNYSKDPCKVGLQIHYREHCNVGVAHGHAMGWRFAPDGKHIIFDTGGLFKQDEVEYKCLKDTTHGNWNSGFSIIHNDYLYQFPKDHTDWDFWTNFKVRNAA